MRYLLNAVYKHEWLLETIWSEFKITSRYMYQNRLFHNNTVLVAFNGKTFNC